MQADAPVRLCILILFVLHCIFKNTKKRYQRERFFRLVFSRRLYTPLNVKHGKRHWRRLSIGAFPHTGCAWQVDGLLDVDEEKRLAYFASNKDAVRDEGWRSRSGWWFGEWSS